MTAKIGISEFVGDVRTCLAEAVARHVADPTQCDALTEDLTRKVVGLILLRKEGRLALIEVGKYMSWRMYSVDFDRCRGILKDMDSTQDKVRCISLLRDAIVQYVKPFSGNFVLAGPKKLDDAIVPLEFKALHEELKKARMQQHAHTDEDYRHPQVVEWIFSGQRSYPMAFARDRLEELFPRVDEFRRMVEAVDANLDRRIGEFQASLK